MSAASTYAPHRTKGRRSVQGSVALLSLAAGATAVLVSRSLFGAAAIEPARVRVAASLFDDLARGLLPFDAVLSVPLGPAADGGAPPAPTAIAVTELRYCGATDKGNGRLRAVLRAGTQGGAASPVLSGHDGCRRSLEDLAKRLTDHTVSDWRDDAWGIADVEAIWRSWELRLVVERIVGPGSSKSGGPRPLAGLESRHDLQVVSTAGLRVVTDSWDALTIHVVPSFLADAIDLAVLLGEDGAGPPGVRSPLGGHVVGSSGGGGNVAADLPHAFANQVIRQLTATRPLALLVSRDVIDLQNVSIGFAPVGLSVTGVATPRSLREPVRLTAQVGGDEAGVLTVRAEPQMESCAGLGTMATIACSARNAGRGAATAALGAALTARYQGQLLRDLAGHQTLRLGAGARAFDFRGEVLHVTATARGVSIAARFDAGGAGGDH